jgi:hypothetical protein
MVSPQYLTMPTGVANWKKRKCTACGEKESGRFMFGRLGETTYLTMDIIGRPNPDGNEKIGTGETIAFKAFVCMTCGHVDLYGEATPPPSELE